MTISVRISDEETKLIKSYAKTHKLSLSALIRNTVLEKVENEYDLGRYKKVIEEYKKNPKTYTFDDLKKELDL